MVPVYRDILADMDTPVSAFRKIDKGGNAFLLESVEGGEKWGRYSILGVDPATVLRSKGKNIEIFEDKVLRLLEGDPLNELKRLMSRYRTAPVEGAPRFCGGAIGYIGYDVVRHIERLPDTSPQELDVYDLFFIFTDTFIVFDNVEHRIKVISNAFIDEGTDVEREYAKATGKIDALIRTLRVVAPQAGAPVPIKVEFANKKAEIEHKKSNFTRAGFCKAVDRAKEYIAAGDIIQTVLSQRFSTRLDVDPFDIYRALRVINPSPYLFFLRLDGLTIVGSSPELLVRVEGAQVNVKPLAGTRKRGAGPDEDMELEQELLRDPKERAEHIMLVDLGRNDLGRICAAGTVEVDELMSVERYSHVMHIVSNVKGTLTQGNGPFEALRACFPAGTLTGAPKIRAMEIIEELEPSKRGVYGGAVGYFSYSGNMDMCIAIRTMVIKDNRIHVQAGAGIVADSVPEKEYEETQNKAMGVFKAIEMARELTD